MANTDTADWTAQYFVPWSQVHPNSRGGQSGNVHLIRATDPGHYSVLPGLRTPRLRGDALCSPSRKAWMLRDPHSGEAVDQRCPRCVKLASKLGIDWPEQAS